MKHPAERRADACLAMVCYVFTVVVASVAYYYICLV
jgi:hypothetical protein